MPSNSAHTAKKSFIGHRLIVYAILFCSSVAFILTGINLHQNYRKEVQSVEKQIKSVAISLSKTDDTLLQGALDNAIGLRDIAYLYIQRKGGQRVTAGKSPASPFITRMFPITIKSKGKQPSSGTLKIFATNEGIHQRLADQIFITLLINTIAIFAAAIFVYLLIQKSFTRNLAQINAYTRQIDPGTTQAPLLLNRLVHPGRCQDELNEMAHLINNMRINLRHSEQRLLEFSETVSDWLWEIDEDLNYIYVSNRFFALSGIAAESFIGSNHKDLYHGEIGSEAWPDHLKQLAAREPFRDFSFSVQHPDGREQWFRLSGHPVFYDEKTFKGYRGTGTDITNEMSAREEVVETTLRFFDAIENVSDGIAFWTSDGNFALCNRIFRTQAGAAEHLLVRGNSYESYLRGLLENGVIGKKKHEWESWVSRRLAERSASVPAKEVYRNGRWLLVRDGHSPDGSIVSVTTDITDLKQHQHQLELITNAVPILLAYIDNEQRYQLINKTHAEWLGRAHDDICGELVADIIDPETFSNLSKYINTALSGKFIQFQINFPRQIQKALETRFIEASFTPDFRQSGEVDGFFVAAIDITDRMQNEAAAREHERAFHEQANILKTSLDAIEEGIGVWDSNDRLVAWNNTFQKLLNYPDKLMKAGTPQSKFRKHLVKTGIDLSLLENPKTSPSANSPQQSRTFDIEMQNDRHISVHHFVLPNGNSVTTFRDITEIKRARLRLHHIQKMEAIGQLTGGIAHDFNNLLSIIMGSLNLLEGQVKQKKFQKLIAAALRASRRGAELTQRLLAFGRRQALTIETADANEIIEGLTELLTRTLGGGTEINTNLSDNLWNMRVDKGQLENALLNLVFNARDAMPGGGTLKIETQNIILDKNYTQRHEDLLPGTYALISVSDSGSGMPPETLERAFDPFFTTKAVGAGTGLGLSMIYGFVKQSGGHIRIYSEVGHGTVVRLYLPTSEQDEDQDIQSASSDPFPDFNSTGERILLIEDDPDVRLTVVNILKILGYEVAEAEGDDQAIKLFEDGSNFDLIFSDVFLHNSLNGPEIVKILHKQRSDIPVLFTSGFTADQLDNTEMLKKNIHFLPKPYETATLGKKLRTLLDHRDST